MEVERKLIIEGWGDGVIGISLIRGNIPLLKLCIEMGVWPTGYNMSEVVKRWRQDNMEITKVSYT